MKKTLKCGKCGEITECEMCNFYSESDCGCKGECVRPDDKGCDCDNCGNQLRKPKNEQKKKIEATVADKWPYRIARINHDGRHIALCEVIQ